ncbi:MAG: hypothetical protein K2Q18_04305 [Bdellovibrionales bacterium]|nr:hypothetical protein [Bdellovibrionales bacterium]
MNKVVTAVVLTFLFSMNTFTAVAGDWSESHGGDSIIAEFKMIAVNLIDIMKKNPSPVYSIELLSQLEKSVKETTILTTNERLILNGIERDAITRTSANSNTIEINIQRWLQYSQIPRNKELLVLHEYLYTVNIDDTDYRFSTIIFNTLINLQLLPEFSEVRIKKIHKQIKECDLSLLENPLNLNMNPSELEEAAEVAAISGCPQIFDYLLSFGLRPNNKIAAIVVISLHNQAVSRDLREKYFSILLSIDVNWGRDLVFDELVCSSEFFRAYPLQAKLALGQSLLTRAIIGMNMYNNTGDIILVRDYQLIEFFISLGHSLTMKDSTGWSALDYASFYKVDLGRFLH